MAGFYWWNERDDGIPGVRPEFSLHHAGQPGEYLRVECAVRVAWYRRTVRLVARAYQETDEVTLALESIRVEGR